MARPRTPTTVLKIRGAYDNHPKRAKDREHEPPPGDPLGLPPECLDEAQRARWLEIASWCPWLEESHRVLVEATCRLWMTIRGAAAKSADYAILTGYLSKLGMTPVDRSKVSMPDADHPKKKSLLA